MSDTPEQQLYAPVQFGPYFVTCLLGTGATTRVYRGFHIGEPVENLVAIKALHPSRADGKMARTRLEREAQIGTALGTHKNLLLPLGREQIGGQDVLVMPYFDGWTLEELIAFCREAGEDVWFNPSAIIDLVTQVTQGLQEAHGLKIDGKEQNLVHRDLKPANIMVGRDGTVKILDFGIATFRDRVGAATRQGITVGTPRYLSPEQARGKALDHRSDLFSLGTILYELVSRKRAFRLLTEDEVADVKSDERNAARFAGMLRAIVGIDPEGRDRSRTEALEEKVPGSGDIVRHCWARDPDDRAISAFQVRLRLGMIKGRQDDGGGDLAAWIRRHEEDLPEAIEDGDFDPVGPPPEILPNDHRTSVFVRVLRPDGTADLTDSAIRLLAPDLTSSEELPLDQDPDFEGIRFGRYRLLCLLGSGANAKVYLARTRGGNIIVLKVLHPDLTDEPSHCRSIENEARLGAILRGQPHDNVVGAFPLERIGGHLCLPMPYVPGWTLDQLLYKPVRRSGGQTVLVSRWGDRNLPVSVVADIGMQICSGLAHVHGVDLGGQPVNVIHRDLKPANIMVTPGGQVKILDFGIAKMDATFQLGAKTRAGTARGTPTYMSPEQASGRPLTPASDLFAVGSILYELTLGEPLFSETDLRDLLMSIVQVDPEVGARRVSGVAPDLVQIIRDCHARDPQERYERAGEIRADLEPVFHLYGGEAKNLAAMLQSVAPRMPKQPSYGSWGKDGAPKPVRDGDTDTNIFRVLEPASIEERFPADREQDPSTVVEIFDDTDQDDVVTEVVASAGGHGRVVVQPLLRGTGSFPVSIEDEDEEDVPSSIPGWIALGGCFILLLAVFLLLLTPPRVKSPEEVDPTPVPVSEDVEVLEDLSVPPQVPEPTPEQVVESPEEIPARTPAPRVVERPTPEPNPEPTPELTPVLVLEKGTIMFMVQPSSKIYINGSMIGETRSGPLRHEIEPGQHNVVFECLACETPGRTHEVTVTVAPGKRATRVYNFSP